MWPHWGALTAIVKAWCSNEVVSGASGICPSNFHTKWLLWNVHVHFDCASSHKTMSPEVSAAIFPVNFETNCSCEMLMCISTAQARTKRWRRCPRPFSLWIPYKMALVTCPCAFRPCRLAQNDVRGVRGHFSCKFTYKMTLVKCPCAFRLCRLAHSVLTHVAHTLDHHHHHYHQQHHHYHQHHHHHNLCHYHQHQNHHHHRHHHHHHHHHYQHHHHRHHYHYHYHHHYQQHYRHHQHHHQQNININFKPHDLSTPPTLFGVSCRDKYCPISLCFYLSICLSVCFSVCLSVCLSLSLSLFFLSFFISFFLSFFFSFFFSFSLSL